MSIVVHLIDLNKKNHSLIVHDKDALNELFFSDNFLENNFQKCIENFVIPIENECTTFKNCVPIEDGIIVINFLDRSVFSTKGRFGPIAQHRMDRYAYYMDKNLPFSHRLKHYTKENLLTIINLMNLEKIRTYSIHEFISKLLDHDLKKIDEEQLNHFYSKTLKENSVVLHLFSIKPTNFNFKINYYDTFNLDKMLLNLYQNGLRLDESELDGWLNYVNNKHTNENVINNVKKIITMIKEKESIGKTLLLPKSNTKIFKI
jgi:hypothetical protein